MDLEEIIKLINTVSNSNLESFSYEEGDLKLQLKNKENQGSDISYTTNSTSTQQVGSENFKFIESPLVGVFYSYNSELKEPYVSVGDIVKEGQVIGIIEAMKLMNEVCSPFNGVVEEILVNNEQNVEYGHQLIKLREE